MADNYLEKKFEDMRARAQAKEAREQRERQRAWKKRMEAYRRRLEDNGKARGYVDTDILSGQRVLEVDRDRDRCQVEVRIRLKHGNNEFRAAVDTLR